MLSQKQLLWRKTKSGLKLAISGSAAFVGIGVWTGDSRFYSQFISPIVSLLPPEFSHNAAVFICKHSLLRSIPSSDSPSLSTTLGPFSLSNPIGVAAGFDKNATALPGLSRLGYSWVEIGSVTPLPQAGNPSPRVFRLPQDSAIINRYGFNNDGHDAVFHRVAAFKAAHPDFIVGVNLGANKTSPNRILDYTQGLTKFNSVCDYFVINISSPNTPNLRDLQNADSLPDLLRSVVSTRNQLQPRRPIYLKVAPDITSSDVSSISSIITKPDCQIDGLIVSNTTVQRSQDLKSPPELVSQTGGLSGRPLEKMSTLLIAKFYEETTGKVPIIGVGGIWNGGDVLKKLEAGASAVQVYSVMAYRGLGVGHQMKKELEQSLAKNGYKSVQEAVGALHKAKQSKTRSAS